MAVEPITAIPHFKEFCPSDRQFSLFQVLRFEGIEFLKWNKNGGMVNHSHGEKSFCPKTNF